MHCDTLTVEGMMAGLRLEVYSDVTTITGTGTVSASGRSTLRLGTTVTTATEHTEMWARVATANPTAPSSSQRSVAAVGHNTTPVTAWAAVPSDWWLQRASLSPPVERWRPTRALATSTPGQAAAFG